MRTSRLTNKVPIHFIERQYPSANSVIISGGRTILVDSGACGDFLHTMEMCSNAGVELSNALVLNTHFHSDHVGGNAGLRQHFNAEIGAHQLEASSMLTDDDPNLAVWLDQQVPRYIVDVPLHDSDVISDGSTDIVVVHTPGHTPGHSAFYMPGERVVITGDLLMANDVGWLNVIRDGPESAAAALKSIDKLASLHADRVLPGHGPELDMRPALEDGKRRYTRFLSDPQLAGWHACKRIFAYALMLRNGLPRNAVMPYLLNRTWLRDFACKVFEAEPALVARELVDRMVASGGLAWRSDRLVPTTPYREVH